MNKKKITALCLTLVLAIALCIGIAGISAYFTDADTVTNTFTVGRVSLDLQEPSWDPDNATAMKPLDTVKKDPQILNDGVNPEYVFMTVTVPYKNIVTVEDNGTKNTAADTELFTYTMNSGWVEVGTGTKDETAGTVTHTYAYGTETAMTELAAGDRTPALFDTVTFVNAVEGQGLEGSAQNIVINAYGIQTTNINGDKTAPADVWTVVASQAPDTAVVGVSEDPKTDVKDGNSSGSEAGGESGGGSEEPVAKTVTSLSVALKDGVTIKTGDAVTADMFVVTADYSDGTTAPMDSASLTVTPATAPNTAGETEFIVSMDGTEISQAITVNVEANKVLNGVYGVSWDGSSNTAWTRTDDAVGLTATAYMSGLSADEYGSDFDDIYPWAGMKTVTRSDVGTVVAIPKFYYKLTSNASGGMDLQITADADVAAANGFSVSPAHMDRGDGAGERDVVYIGRYHSGSDYKSTSGVTPLASITRSTARSGISALGSDVWQSDYATRLTVEMLYLVEYADWNSQAVIGAGCSTSGSIMTMGYTDSMPYHTGTTQSSRETYGGTQYRNIEGLWDNVFDWMDGCYYNSNGMNVILNPANFSDSANGTLIGKPVGGWSSAFAVADGAGFPMFYPTAASGSDSTYMCDYWNFNGSYPCLYAGGYCNQSGNRGLFCVSCRSASSVSSSVGARLQVLP